MASLSGSLTMRAGPGPRLRSVGQQQASRMVPELIALASASLLCMALYWVGSTTPVSFIAALTMLVVMAVANFRMVGADPAMMLTPLFGARLIAMVLFGIGSLFNQFAPADTQFFYNNLYPYTDADAAKVNLLWLLGMTVLLAATAAAMHFQRPGSAPIVRRSLAAVPVGIGLWMFQLSFAATVGKVLLLIFAGITIPGIFDPLILGFQLCGLFLLAQHVGTSRKAVVTLVAGLIAVLFAAVLLQAKTLALYPALIIMIGLLSSRVTWRRVLASAALIITIFVVISPIVTYGRERMSVEYGDGGDGSFSDRWRYVSDYVGGERSRADDAGLALARLDYVMPATFIMAQYDEGIPSDRLATSAYIFVPRLIWPDKPVTSGAALETNYLMGLQTTNNIGVTTFVDLYWNVGWYALFISAAIGVYFGIITVVCHGLVVRGEWLMIPFALSSLRLALSLDTDFTSGIMAPAVMNLIIYAGLRFVTRFVKDLPVAGGAGPTRAPAPHRSSPFPGGGGRGGV